ncbi:MAG: protein kinase [Actinobacteria bacterium]|nr:protein kinase [Actinomycetota bacterium]
MSSVVAGRYEILEIVGQGGQGSVARALDRRHDRMVALKRRPTGSAAYRETLLQETRLLLTVRPHPSLPLVREDFFSGRSYYIVSDWVDGTPLSSVLRERGDPGLPLTTVVRYLSQVADALDHLHSQDPPIIHRDVKPGNLILTAEGRIVLVDFGIAEAKGSEGAPTGSRGYAPPELTYAVITPAADIFGFAATAFTLLTGEPPNPAVRWDDVEAPVAKAIERAIRPGLATNPARRPRTASTIVEAMRAWLDASPSTDVVNLPSGTVTFVFTDIEGSTRLMEKLGERTYAEVLNEHRSIIEAAFERCGGRVLETEGDGSFAVFSGGTDAVEGCVGAQQELASRSWPESISLAVRMGIHTGEAMPDRNGGYVSAAVHRAARVASAAHGGQVLLSGTTAELTEGRLPEITLLDLGDYLLKNFDEPIRLFQIAGPGLRRDFPPPRAPVSVRTNLTEDRTSFIGRAAQIDELTRLLTRARLVTVVGPGGAGKTRLAIQTARRLIGSRPDGVWFVDLSRITDDAHLPRALAAVFGLRERPGASLTDIIVEHLAELDLLILLDNCEHVVEAAAEVADALLRRCARVGMLTTSREPLLLEDERVWAISPLSLPSQNAASDSEAVTLFVDRARMARSDLVIDDDARTAITEICERLEGIPLALELAAARVSSLDVREIAIALASRIDLGAGFRRGGPVRQRTLEATVHWSYSMLDDRERVILRRLAVLPGGFTDRTARQLLPEESDLGLMESLTRRSLVQHDPIKARYRMLEIIRQFGLERLEASSEERDSFAALIRWAVDFTASFDRRYRSTGAEEPMAEADEEIDNVRAAMDYALLLDPAAALEICIGSAFYWLGRGLFREATDRFAAAIAAADGAPLPRRAIARVYGSWNLTTMGRFDESEAMLQEAVKLARSGGDSFALARALNALGVVQHLQERNDAAEPYLLEARTIALGTDDEFALSLIDNSLGEHYSAIGDYARALPYLTSSVERSRRIRDSNLAAALIGLGRAQIARGSRETARSLIEEALTLASSLRDREQVAHALELCAMVAGESDAMTAAVLLGASEQVLTVSDAVRSWNPASRRRLDHALESMLGEARFRRLRQEGSALSLADAVQRARILIAQAPSPPAP